MCILWECNICITNSFTQGWNFKMLSYTCYYIRFMQANIFWGKVQKQNSSFNNWSGLCCQLSSPAATCHSLHLYFSLSTKFSSPLLFRCQSEADEESEIQTQVHWAHFYRSALLDASNPRHPHKMPWATRHPPSVTLLSPPWLTASVVVHAIAPFADQTFTFPGSSSHRVVRHCSSFLKCLWLEMVETYSYFCISVVCRTCAFSLYPH